MSAIPAGYKQTEAGVIPEDWNLAVLGEISTTSSGTTPARDLADRYFRNGTVNWVKTLDLNNSDVTTTDESVTPKAVEETCLRPYPPGTVLVAMYGGFNQIGRTGLLRIVAAVNQAITAIQPRASLLNSEYLLAALNFKVEYWKAVASSSRKDPNITSQDIRAFPVALPPLPEQRAIAAALSDVDALLAKLDQFIAKKRDLKQAVMQQLLTGQTRLPEFSGAWEVKRVDEFGEVVTGGTPRTDVSEYWGEGFPWITPTDISSAREMSESERSITQQGLNAIRALPRNTVLVTCIASIGKNAILKTEGGCNQQINAVVPNRDHSAEFLYFLFEASKQYLLANAGTTATSIISKATFSKLIFSVPSVKEQTAIATVLSDMDVELTALEARRDKTRALKQGMMQELLTGRIRLV